MCRQILAWLARGPNSPKHAIKARRLGISHITMHREDWALAGCPMAVRVYGKVVEVRPTGRKPGRWIYYFARPIRTVSAWQAGWPTDIG